MPKEQTYVNSRKLHSGISFLQSAIWNKFKSISSGGYSRASSTKYNFNTAEKIRNNIYVDNVITGSESVENAVKFYTEAKQLFMKAGMNLCDWATNNQETLDIIESEIKSCAEKMKILGLTWIMRIHLCGETHKTIQFLTFIYY